MKAEPKAPLPADQPPVPANLPVVVNEPATQDITVDTGATFQRPLMEALIQYRTEIIRQILDQLGTLGHDIPEDSRWVIENAFGLSLTTLQASLPIENPSVSSPFATLSLILSLLKSPTGVVSPTIDEQNSDTSANTPTATAINSDSASSSSSSSPQTPITPLALPLPQLEDEPDHNPAVAAANHPINHKARQASERVVLFTDAELEALDLEYGVSESEDGQENVAEEDFGEHSDHELEEQGLGDDIDEPNVVNAPKEPVDAVVEEDTGHSEDEEFAAIRERFVEENLEDVPGSPAFGDDVYENGQHDNDPASDVALELAALDEFYEGDDDEGFETTDALDAEEYDDYDEDECAEGWENSAEPASADPDVAAAYQSDVFVEAFMWNILDEDFSHASIRTPIQSSPQVLQSMHRIGSPPPPPPSPHAALVPAGSDLDTLRQKVRESIALNREDTDDAALSTHGSFGGIGAFPAGVGSIDSLSLNQVGALEQTEFSSAEGDEAELDQEGDGVVSEAGGVDDGWAVDSPFQQDEYTYSPRQSGLVQEGTGVGDNSQEVVPVNVDEFDDFVSEGEGSETDAGSIFVAVREGGRLIRCETPEFRFDAERRSPSSYSDVDFDDLATIDVESVQSGDADEIEEDAADHVAEGPPIIENPHTDPEMWWNDDDLYD